MIVESLFIFNFQISLREAEATTFHSFFLRGMGSGAPLFFDLGFARRADAEFSRSVAVW